MRGRDDAACHEVDDEQPTRAYEGLLVAVFVIAAVLVFGGSIAIALSSSLADVARALSA